MEDDEEYEGEPSRTNKSGGSGGSGRPGVNRRRGKGSGNPGGRGHGVTKVSEATSQSPPDSSW